MLDMVRNTIQKYNMFSSGDRVLVGVSGGPDSVALVHILNRLSGEMGLKIAIAHLNHCLRGQDAADDANFVRNLAAQLQISAVIEEEDVAKYSADWKLTTQAGAREVRYRFFERTAQRLECNKLATAHNANDQAETVLMNFLRGSGSAGLAGIPPVREGWIVRPLLEVSRAYIEIYCKENQLATRLDKSNLKTAYTRNKTRLELIPILEREYNNNLVETLKRTSEIFREEEEYLQELTLKYWDQVLLHQEADIITVSLESFSVLPRLMQKRILRLAWVRLTSTSRCLEFVHLENAIEWIREKPCGSKLNWPMGVIIIKDYKKFVVSKQKEAEMVGEYCYDLQVPGLTSISEIGASILAIIETGANCVDPKKDEITIDLDLIKLPLQVRCRRPGEVFKPSGFHGTKRLKKFLIDSKISQKDRALWPILVSGLEEIIWIVGLRADRRWLATPNSTNILKLKLM